MTTAQDQQSRAEFEAHMRKLSPCVRLYRHTCDGGDKYRTVTVQRSWELWQAARALPAGVTPVAKIHKGKLTWSIPWPEYSVDTALLTGDHDLFTAAQVLAMGRVPLNMGAAWDAFSEAVRSKVGVKELVNIMGSVESLRAIFLAAAPRPPAAQEQK